MLLLSFNLVHCSVSSVVHSSDNDGNWWTFTHLLHLHSPGPCVHLRLHSPGLREDEDRVVSGESRSQGLQELPFISSFNYPQPPYWLGCLTNLSIGANQLTHKERGKQKTNKETERQTHTKKLESMQCIYQQFSDIGIRFLR